MIKRPFMFFNFLIAFALLLSAAGTPITASAIDNPEGPQKPDALNIMPAPIIEFPGINRDSAFNLPLVPADAVIPDTSGAAGHTHFLQAVNTALALYRKDGTLIDALDFNSFWSTSAATGTLCDLDSSHHGQPYVMYDHMAHRWVVVDVAYTDIDNGPYYLCTSVSNSLAAPLVPGAYFDAAHWYFYALRVNNGVDDFYPDAPKLGLWPDGYYLAVDVVDVENGGLTHTPRGVMVWALNRDDMVNNIVAFRKVPFHLPEQRDYEHLVPSNLLGDPPPTGTPNYFASIQPGEFHIWEFKVDWLDIYRSEFGKVDHEPSYNISTDTSQIWAIGYYVPQLGTSEDLDVLGDRLGSPLQYRIVDGVPSLWATHTIQPGKTEYDFTSALRWYEIQFAQDGQPAFYQTGNYPNQNGAFPDQWDGNYRWLPSLGVDRVGNMAVGFSISSSLMYPSIKYAGRLKSQAAGELPLGEATLQIGAGYQNNDNTVSDGPWGRQSQMSLDPMDECVFWYTNMYYEPAAAPPLNENWRTRIGWFSMPACRGGLINRVSLSTDNIQGNLASGEDFEMYAVATSANGRWVAFSSEASTLVTDDNNNKRDVFVRDRDTDGDGLYDEPGEVQTIRIPAMGGQEPNGNSWEVSISSDGRYVAFSSDANNFVSNDTNGTRDVFVYDRQLGDLIRVSVVNGSVNDNGFGKSDQPFISGDGRYVVFRSLAQNLVTGDTNIVADVFLRDTALNSTLRISEAPGDVQLTAESGWPTISGDGRYVAFQSKDATLGPGDVNGTWDIFISEWAVDTIIPVSVAFGGGAMGNAESYHAFISEAGLHVAFASRANNLTDPLVDPDTNLYADIFLFDQSVAPATLIRVSLNFFGGEAINGDSYSPSLTSDGRYITFASRASNLDVFLPDLNSYRDIFLHDRSMAAAGVYDVGLTQRISLNTNRGEPNNHSFAPVIASGGRHVAFVSEASDLVTNDTNNAWDVFAYDNQRLIPIFLTIPGNIPGVPGQVVSVPVEFKDNDQEIDTTTFSIDYDHDCLSFDPALTGAVQFNVSSAFTAYYSFDGNDTDGEIDFSIYDQVEPRDSLPTGTLVTIKLRVKATCQALPGSSNAARVGFSADPLASFGNRGLSIKGLSVDGFVRVLDGKLGDCNGDTLVNAGDLSGLVLEIFDGDGYLPANTPSGTFPGNAVGCNPNQDYVVDAGDLSCTVDIIFGGGTAGCTGMLPAPSRMESGQLSKQATVEPLNLFIAENVVTPANQEVQVPIILQTNGNAVHSAVFSVDFDQSWLTFDDKDGDGNGIPDDIVFSLPDGVSASVVYDALDTDAELDFVIYGDSMSDLLHDGVLATVTLLAGDTVGKTLASVRTSNDPIASFGSSQGTSLLRKLYDGSVWIMDVERALFMPFVKK